jgi:hypothetical protein
MVEKSGAFSEERAALFFWTIALDVAFPRDERTKKNRPNFRWNGFPCSLTVSRPHRSSRCIPRANEFA